MRSQSEAWALLIRNAEAPSQGTPGAIWSPECGFQQPWPDLALLGLSDKGLT